MRVLGPGAYGDPERPWLTREEFDAEKVPAFDPAAKLVVDDDGDDTPASTIEDVS